MTIYTPTPKTVLKAAHKLRSGGVVSFPTETVYGLGCDTFNKSAVSIVYKLKSRPRNNPMITHILNTSWVNTLCTGWDNRCQNLAQHFWPGPLTLVLPKKDSVPTEACGGFNTIAIRCPSHDVAVQLLKLFDGPISAPSANKHGHISPTTAQHVEDEFGKQLMVLDGGPCEKGIESTVLSMVNTPTVLRPGSITPEEISKITGRVETTTTTTQTNSPGTTGRHYAPNTPTKLFNKDDVETHNNGAVVLVIESAPKNVKHVIHMPDNASDYAKKLYASLRYADAIGATQICIEKPQDTQRWQAVLDRLHRCCAE